MNWAFILAVERIGTEYRFVSDGVAIGLKQHWYFGPEHSMNIRVNFYSYFKELTGAVSVSESLPEGSTLGDLYRRLVARFPKLAAMEKSTLIAVDVEYQGRDHVLREGDEVSLLPQVQGG